MTLTCIISEIGQVIQNSGENVHLFLQVYFIIMFLLILIIESKLIAFVGKKHCMSFFFLYFQKELFVVF